MLILNLRLTFYLRVLVFHLLGSRRESIAVVHVLDVGGSKSLNEICWQSFNLLVPKLKNSSLRQPSQFQVTVSQVFGIVKTKMSSTGSYRSDTAVEWNQKLTDAEPKVNMLHVAECMSGIQSPLLLVVSSKFLQENGGNPDVLNSILQEWMNGLQQLDLHVVIADETSGDLRGDENEANTITKLLATCLKMYRYKLWYWKASQHTFLTKLSCKNENIFSALKFSAIDCAKDDTLLLQNFEKIIFEAKQAGARTLSLQTVVERLGSSTIDKHSLSQLINQLEHKGLILRRSFVRSGLSTGSGHIMSTSKHFIDGFPQILIISPMWFCSNVSQFIQAVCDQRNKEDEHLVPSAHNSGFYSEEILKLANRSFPGCVPQEVKKLLELSGVIFNIANSSSGSEINDSEVYVAKLKSPSTSSPNYRSSYLIPGTLRVESLPPVSGQAVFPIALRVPGIRLTDIPLTVFHEVVSMLTKRFPLAVKCTRYEARFNVQSNHVLQLVYKRDYACIMASVYVETQDPTFMSTATAAVCVSIRDLLSFYIKQQLDGTVGLQFAAVTEFNCDDQVVLDFVDLGTANVTPTDQLYSVGNHPFYPPDNFYLWFGSVGKVCLIYFNLYF